MVNSIALLNSKSVGAVARLGEIIAFEKPSASDKSGHNVPLVASRQLIETNSANGWPLSKADANRRTP